MFLFTYTLNMIVHTVMYSYYFVSLFTKSIHKIIAIKKSITIMQMVSFSLCYTVFVEIKINSSMKWSLEK